MNEEVTRELMKKEAEARIKMLNLHPNAVHEFVKEGKLNRSDYRKIGPLVGGALFWLTGEEKAMVKAIEDKYNILVYHLTHENVGDLGECYDMLYVSDDTDEWELDRDDLKAGMPIAYVYNKTYPDCSEFGAIGIKAAQGGLVRTA